jgi:uncharacterized protein (DUF3820 family)
LDTNNKMIMPFGKHKGEPMDEVPASYLDWLHGQSWIGDWPEVLKYIKDHKHSIREELGLNEEDVDL